MRLFDTLGIQLHVQWLLDNVFLTLFKDEGQLCGRLQKASDEVDDRECASHFYPFICRSKLIDSVKVTPVYYIEMTYVTLCSD